LSPGRVHAGSISSRCGSSVEAVPNPEVWDADVLKDQDERLYLGEWRVMDSMHEISGALFDPVLEAMNEKTSGWRRLLRVAVA